MKIIFRNPFVSRKRKAQAKIDLMCADAYDSLAQSELVSNNYTVTDNIIEHKKKKAECLNDAAKNLGFRNSTDMEYYNKKLHHGKRALLSLWCLFIFI
ncbi:MAG: hypothetical protein NC215_00390 [Ruminococcus sp.]|nr:hypothetical protein [Ruminococcus sp.]